MSRNEPFIQDGVKFCTYIPSDDVEFLDGLVYEKEYRSRNAAIRDAVRRLRRTYERRNR